jgi:RND family efflux transporter MFP subunit
MPQGEMNDVVDQLRGVALRDEAAPTDGELLEAFVARGDGPAFEALVRRHAPMVLGVCRRVAGHDADDAFQAAFLVLVRKAGSVVPRELVGNWLYGVAYRTALKARALAGRRRQRERPMTDVPQHPSLPDDHAELVRLLDRELERLPAKYRLPIVLCDLEGRTRRDAARQLGLPTGTLSGRLTSARRLLAKRLARRGLAFSGTALGAALANQAAAEVPKDIVSCTIKAAALFAAGSAAAAVVSGNAAHLAEGVIKSMLLTKLKLVTVILAGVIVIGAGALAHDRPGSDTPQPPRETPAKPSRAATDQAKSDLDVARTNVDLAALRVNEAEEQLRKAHQQLERAQADYQRLRQRAAKETEKPPLGATKPGRDVLIILGQLRPARVVQITPSVSGKIAEVHVEEGDRVAAGQVLATLDAGSLRNDFERARVNVELAQARLQEAKAGQSDEKIHASTAAARVQVAEAELKRAEIEMNQAKTQLEKTQLIAPITGVVARRRVEVGDTVHPGQGQPAASRLFELIDPRGLLAEVTVPENELGSVFVGQRVRVEATSRPGTIMEGKVERIAPTVDRATATVTVQVAMKVPDGETRWKPGMTVRVAFQAKE